MFTLTGQNSMWNPPRHTMYNQHPAWADAEGIVNEIMENARAGK